MSSINSYLGCKDCKECVWINEPTREVQTDPLALSQFLEKHYGHHLVYVWDDLHDADEFEVHKPSKDGFWSHGQWIPDAPEPRLPREHTRHPPVDSNC